MKALIPLLGLALATTLVAQSPLRSLYAANNGGAAGGQVFFDLQVNTTITLTGFDLNLNVAVGGAGGSIEVRTRNGSYLGQELSPAQWQANPIATGVFTANPVQTQTPVCLSTPIVLNPGLTGFCIRYIGAGAAYTNGTGTVVPGGGGANQTFATAEATLLAGSAQNTPWVGSFQPRVFNGSLNYTVGSTGLPCSTNPATNLFYGAGCYSRPGSWYDGFVVGATAPVAAQQASTNLTGRSVSWLPNGSGYIVLPNLAGVTYVPPTAAATTLAGFVPSADDGDVAVTLTTPFPYGAGVLNALTVHTNGMVSTGSNEAFFNLNGFVSFQPTVRRLLDAPEALWACWHDFNPAELNSGQIKFEEVGGVAFITWDDVESYPGTATVANQNRSTIQFQFDSTSGQVNLVFQSINAAGVGNNVSDLYLVGYSQPGLGADNGETDITTFTQLTMDGLVDRRPLTLNTTDRPVLGNLVRFATTDETPSATPFGVLFVSLADLPPFSPIGLDLGIIGAPGCVANMDPNVAPLQIVLTNLIPGGMNSQFTIPVLPTAVGLSWYAQSVWLDPAVNTFGLLTSNAIQQTLGTW